jgi:hypothetical protein
MSITHRSCANQHHQNQDGQHTTAGKTSSWRHAAGTTKGLLPAHRCPISTTESMMHSLWPLCCSMMCRKRWRLEQRGCSRLQASRVSPVAPTITCGCELVQVNQLRGDVGGGSTHPCLWHKGSDNATPCNKWRLNSWPPHDDVCNQGQWSVTPWQAAILMRFS